MPGIPLVARETTNSVSNCSYARSADQMCRQDSRVHLSAEEEAAAEESLSIYCKPVELYNIIQRRAANNPLFLQRCLKYKIQAKHKRRIQMTISLPLSVNDELRLQSIFPLCILLARPVPSLAVAEDSAVYRFSRICMLTSCTGVEGINQAQAKFILPEISKLSEEVKSGSLAILFISCAELTKDQIDMTSFPSNVSGHCFLGKIPMELLHLSWEKSPNLSLGERVEMLSTVDMLYWYMKSSCLDEDKCISFQIPHISGALSTSQQLQVIITAEEVGAKERSPYDLYSYSDVPTSSLPDVIRLRNGNVVFNYRYYNNRLQRTEVTEDFSCPFCLVKCASFKGLRCHLTSSHDLFNFEFWVTEEYQAVNVSVKTDTWGSEVAEVEYVVLLSELTSRTYFPQEVKCTMDPSSNHISYGGWNWALLLTQMVLGCKQIVADGVDPKQQTFFFCSKPHRRRKPKSSLQNAWHVHPLVLDLPETLNELPDKTEVGTTECAERDASSPNITGVSSATAQSNADPECVQSLPGSNLTAPSMLQFAKTRKLSVERSDPRNRALLQKRQFFHSHRAQPMASEQLLSDQDSEDEVDDDVADLEDRRMLDDFVDVTKDEKQMMHLWNSFVRKQRVLADGHIPWACEAFTKLHGQDFIQAPALLWCWRLFMIKLWNHGLLDARTMNNCNVILEQCRNQDADTMKS